jgi:hypothetical protein
MSSDPPPSGITLTRLRQQLGLEREQNARLRRAIVEHRTAHRSHALDLVGSPDPAIDDANERLWATLDDVR